MFISKGQIYQCSHLRRKKQVQNSLLSNINDNGDNREKIKCLKTWVRIFRVGIFWMEIIWGDGSFPGWSFPDTRFVLFIKVLLSLLFVF